MKIKDLVFIAITAALYAVITVILAPISYYGVQVRISEALTLLPFFYGIKAAVGLWIGVMIANVFGGLGLIDIIFGALITLIAGLFTAKASNIYQAGIYPVLFNAFGIALILYLVLELPYWITVLQVGLGQFISVYIVGVPLIRLIVKKLNESELEL